MAHKVNLVQNDTAPDLHFTVKNNDGSVKNLTGCTVDFLMKAPSGTTINSAHSTCTIDSATAGTCHYVFQSGDLSEAGTYTCDLQVTNSDGSIQTEYTQTNLKVRAENG